MLLINCSNRENNCYKILNDIKSNEDKLISLANKNIKFCLGCNKCIENIDNHCIIDDYITENVYKEMINEKNIVIVCPMYMSSVNAILKNLIDRLNPFYHHELLKGKSIYLVLTGQATKEDNEEEINNIIKWFNGISEWLYFKFEFLDYFKGYNDLNDEENYNSKIKMIRSKLNNSIEYNL